MKKALRKLSSLTMALFMVLQVILPAFPAKAQELNPHHITGIEEFKDDEKTNISRLKAYEIEDKREIDHDKFSMAIKTDPYTSKFRLVLRNDLKLYDDQYFESKDEASKEFKRVKKHLNDQGLDIDISLTEDEQGFRILTDEEFEKFNKGKDLENPYGENYSYIDLKVLDDFDFNEKGFSKDSEDLIFKLDFIRYESIDPNFNIFKIDQDGNLTIENEGDILATIKDDKVKTYTSQNILEDFKLLDEYKNKKEEEKAQKEEEKKAKEKEEAEKRAQKEQEEKAQEEKAQADKKAQEEKEKKEAKEKNKEEENKKDQEKSQEDSKKDEDESKEKPETEKSDEEKSKDEKSQEGQELEIQSDNAEIKIESEDKSQEKSPSDEKAPADENKEEIKEDKESQDDEKSKDEGDESKEDEKEEDKIEDSFKDKSFDDLDPSQKEEIKEDKKSLDIKDKEDESIIDGLKDNIKDIFSKDSDNLKKADKELKDAIKSGKSLEDIQNLLYKLGHKYDLDRKDQEKLMAKNDRAIKNLVKDYRENNISPNSFRAKDGLEGKKFTIQTRFKTSTAVGPILKGQYFTIHLDDKLKVNDPESLEPIRYNSEVIAKPEYDENQKTITYKITRNINDNIDIPINIDVDYDLTNIPQGNDDLVITNRVSGLGVKDPKDLLPVKVDRNGNVKGNLVEPGKSDVTQIIDPDNNNYKVYMDAKANPSLKDGNLTGYNWQVTITSDHDLSSNFINLATNFTLVKGSGLKEIKNIKLNGNDVNLTDNGIKDKFGIVDSKHHDAKVPSNTYVYNFYTPLDDINNKEKVQEKYMLDISMLVRGQEKAGALRFVVNGYEKGEVEERTPNRVGMNNRTTVEGVFKSNDTASWTVTDAISSKDDENNASTAMPLETRNLSENQSLTSSKMAAYKLDTDKNSKTYGQMIVSKEETTTNGIPQAKSNPRENQGVGAISVYEFNTNLKTDSQDKKYSLAGVEISTTADESIYQEWKLNDKINKMPAQSLEVVDYEGNNVLTNGENENGKKVIKLPQGNESEKSRSFIIENVKTWNIKEDGSYDRLGHKVIQHLPKDENIEGKTYEYLENRNFYSWDEGRFYIFNMVREKTKQVPASISLIKKDKKTGKPLKGAVFTLLGNADNTKADVSTGNDGRANFSNVLPGVYSLVENKAPAGYKLDSDSKQVTVQNDGTVNISGENIKLDGKKAEHTVGSSAYPDYMNTLHYAVKNGDKVDFYIMLKPDENNKGETNKDTRLNLDIDGADLTGVEMYDVSNSQRESVRQNVSQLAADKVLSSLSRIGNGGGVKPIEINELTSPDPHSNKSSGYQIKIPKERFNKDWAFLVKVSAKANDDNISPSFEWLTENNTANEVKTQKDNIGLSQKDENPKVDVEIANEKFNSEPVKVVKLDNNRANPTEKAGAVFELKDEAGNLLSSLTTNEKGEADFGNLPQGKYTLEEVQAPKGFTELPLIFDVTVKDDGSITYSARHKLGGEPIPGWDYIIENVEMTQEKGEPTTEIIRNEMVLNEEGTNRVGKRKGVWEAFSLESYQYYGEVKMTNVVPGSTLTFDFDSNLDFKTLVANIPKITNNDGLVIAEPYFDYDGMSTLFRTI